MAQMFSVKCDLCKKDQVEEDAAKISGTMFSMNGITKHACAECVKVLDGIFSAGEDVKEPMKAISRIAKERDDALRQLQALRAHTGGQVLTLEDMVQQRSQYKLLNPSGGLPPSRLPAPEVQKLGHDKKDHKEKGKDKRR
jgi:hypothetical protein